MKEQKYKQLNDYMLESKNRSTTIKALHDILPVIMMVFYPLQLVFLFINEGFKSEVFLKATFVPLGVFIIVTVLRLIINAKRPYEKLVYTPVVKKDTKGKSFPSRHTASAFIIAMAFLYIQTSLGVIMLILASIIALTRVLSGVHYIRDVIGGALISIITGILCFFLI